MQDRKVKLQTVPLRRNMRNFVEQRKKRLAEILSMYRLNDNGCWEWQGYISGAGYGQFRFIDKIWLAHRFFYEHYRGPITNQCIDHLCRNPRCVNPQHLECVSIRENTLRGVGPAAIRARMKNCYKCGAELVGHLENGVRLVRRCPPCRRSDARRRSAAKRSLMQEKLK